MTMEWNERFATGVEHLDHQHRMLFQMESDLSQALAKGGGAGVYAEFLRSLDMYSRMHFAAEEECMFRFQCPAASANLDGHRAFRTLLDDSEQKFKARGYRHDDATATAEAIRFWLVSHIGRIDTQLRPLVDPLEGAG